MKGSFVSALALAALMLASPLPAAAIPPVAGACGTLAAEAASQALVQPGDTLLVGRLVFVTFPDSRSGSLPSYADSMAAELTHYLETQARGRWRVDIRVIKRTNDSTRAWLAPQAAATYAAGGLVNYRTANREVCAAISAARADVWRDVDQVWIIHDQCAFQCTDNSSRASCEDTCPYGGIATIGTGDPDVPGLIGGGTTQRVFVNAGDVRNHQIQLSFAVHEFGHRLMSTGHTPGSDAPDSLWTNFGRYDVMRSGVNGSFAREEGLVPYAAMHLARWGWLDRVVIDRDTRGVRLPDVNGPRGVLVEIATRSPRQVFALAHYAGETPFDARYGAPGLLLWHIVREAAAGFETHWDVECAGGRYTNGVPDPANGRDGLEAAPFALGLPGDLFGARAGVAFGAWTNPSSRLHERDDAYAPETAWSGVTLENLRTDPTNGDLIVDLWLTPAQEVLGPAAGEQFAAGEPVPIRWQPRASAGGVDVDLQASVDGGATWSTIAAHQPNSGAWDWHPTAGASAARVRVVSRDSSGVTGASVSEAFAIEARVAPLPAAVAFANPTPNPSAEAVLFAFELPAASRVHIEVRDAAGRLVRTLVDAPFAAGSASTSWDGRDAQGTRVSPGLYFVRCEAGGRSFTRRVVRFSGR